MGNYLTWQEAASRIEGFPSPIFKGFYSFWDGEQSLRLKVYGYSQVIPK